MKGNTPVADRDKTAQRLLRSSAKSSYDPEIDIDWDAPLPEDLPYLPYEHSSLYGTPLWDTLTERQRIELTKHELASLLSSGVWFEMLLMRMMLKDIYDDKPTSGHFQYALTEIADECRHSTMFGKAVKLLGTPTYGPIPLLHHGGKLLVALSSGPSMYASILVAEEILDRFQRAQMQDERVQPLVRMINRIHVLEEARHIGFAREEVLRRMRDCKGAQLAYHQYLTGLIAYCIVFSFVHPRVYRAVGLPPKETHRIAWHSEHFQRNIKQSGERIVSFLDDAGLIGKPGLQWWKKAHLL